MCMQINSNLIVNYSLQASNKLMNNIILKQNLMTGYGYMWKHLNLAVRPYLLGIESPGLKPRLPFLFGGGSGFETKITPSLVPRPLSRFWQWPGNKLEAVVILCMTLQWKTLVRDIWFEYWNHWQKTKLNNFFLFHLLILRKLHMQRYCTTSNMMLHWWGGPWVLLHHLCSLSHTLTCS